MAEENPQFNFVSLWEIFLSALGVEIDTQSLQYLLMIYMQHREWRSFFSPGGAQQSKFAPAYYHVSLSCTQKNWPMFQPHQLIATPDVASSLLLNTRTFYQCLAIMSCSYTLVGMYSAFCVTFGLSNLLVVGGGEGRNTSIPYNLTAA